MQALSLPSVRERLMSGWKITTRPCKLCREPFQGRSHMVWCSDSCRQRAYRQRRRKRELGLPPDGYTEGQIVGVLGEVLPMELDDLIDVITEKLRAL